MFKNIAIISKHFLEGCGYPLRAFKLFMVNPRYWVLAIIPIILNMLVYLLVGYLFYYYLLPYSGRLIPTTSSENVYLVYCFFILRIILKGTVLITFFIIFLLSFTAFFFVVASPFVDALSIRVERDKYAFVLQDNGWLQMGRDIWMSMKNSVWMAFLSIFWTILFFPLNFIVPIVGFIPGLLAASYFLGISMLIYSMEHRRIPRKQFRSIFRNNRSLILGFGLVVYGVLLIPFSGIIFLPVAVIAGTMLYNEKLDQTEQEALLEGKEYELN